MALATFMLFYFSASACLQRSRIKWYTVSAKWSIDFISSWMYVRARQADESGLLMCTWNEGVPKIIINDTLNLFFKTALGIFVISNHSSFRVNSFFKTALNSTLILLPQINENRLNKSSSCYYVRWQRGTARNRPPPAALLCAVQQSIDMP